MESNRLNIVREKSPTVIFQNRNAFTSTLAVQDKGQLDVELEVVGSSLEMDDNGNEIVRYTLKVIKASKFDPKLARL